MAKRTYAHSFDPKTGKVIVVELQPGDMDGRFNTPKGQVTRAMRKSMNMEGFGTPVKNKTLGQKIRRAAWG